MLLSPRRKGGREGGGGREKGTRKWVEKGGVVVKDKNNINIHVQYW